MGLERLKFIDRNAPEDRVADRAPRDDSFDNDRFRLELRHTNAMSRLENASLRIFGRKQCPSE